VRAAVRSGAWRVWLAADAAGPHASEHARAWLALADRVAATAVPCHRSKHAATYRTRVAGREVYLKRYHRYRRRTDFKDMLRASKARHVLEVSAVLAAAGFMVPRVLAAAEARRGRVLHDAWVATAALAGTPVAARLAVLGAPAAAGGARRARLAEKRRLLAAIGAAVARLHAGGFVAGDLVASNVWVVGEGPGEAVAFLDHDRTRAGRAPTRWSQARRNLVQLNRLVLSGVVATDRLRVYRAYAGARRFGRATARRRLRWVIAKTVERRRRLDGVANAATLGFRRLMGAGPDAAPPGGP
jgi:tRNA A-37 threonylcarbamoyl transferase component Bud32